MAYPYVPPVQNRFVTVKLADVSTAGQVFVAPGFNGRIRKITTALGAAISTADAGLTAKIGGVAVTGGAITIAQSGSAAGDLDFCLPTGANNFTDAQTIEIETDGASSTTAEVVITMELEPA